MQGLTAGLHAGHHLEVRALDLQGVHLAPRGKEQRAESREQRQSHRADGLHFTAHTALSLSSLFSLLSLSL